MAINIYTEAKVEFRNDQQIHLSSSDLQFHIQFPSINELHHKHDLELVSRAIQFFNPERGISLKVNSNVYKGSGLGASSSLLISVCGALNVLLETNYSKDELISIAQGIETTTISIPTGRQDYIAAMYGGINVINFGIADDAIHSFTLSSEFLNKLKKSLVLAYIEPHSSMISNWDVFKLFIDKSPETIHAMTEIKHTANKMHQAVKEENISALSDLIQEEWDNRIRLSDKVCTEKMNAIIQQIKQVKLVRYKVIGAGGGGCMLFYVQDNRNELIDRLIEAGGSILDFEIDFSGMTIL
ncbi:MAG: GHMP family kinase ATP-binding protein [Candidatus Kariarchaeaceae archaeon]|jgi:D-glycero-alpha-D-manno-heptose-7-phosphate kinase